MNPQLVSRSCKGLRPDGKSSLELGAGPRGGGQCSSFHPGIRDIEYTNIAYTLVDKYIDKYIDNINGM
jgi:hypothetical protein